MANITLIPEDCSCYIALRLKEKDSMRVFMTPWGDEVDTEGKEFLVIYCDSYGDPDTVNDLIIDKLTNYNIVFHYIIEGRRCTPYEENSYYEIFNEPEAPEPMSREELQLLEDSLDSNTFMYVLEEKKGMIMSNVS